MVWARGPAADDKPQNLGALKVDSDLTGELETLTSLRTFDLSITVEPTATAPTPASSPVLTAHIARK